MLDFISFKNRDIQNCIQLLNIFEADGVTDIRFVREQLQNHINEQFKTATNIKIKQNKHTRNLKRNTPRCPSCGSFNWQIGKRIGGVKYNGCPDCYYSEMVK